MLITSTGTMARTISRGRSSGDGGPHISPEVRMFTIPSLANLIANHPTGTQESVAALIGGTVKANISNPAYTSYKNTCAIRISRALNYAGDPIPASAGGITNPYMADHKIRYDM